MDLNKLKQLSLVLVTPYKNPDLDGYASAFAYAQYLSSNGVKAQAAITGNPDAETEFLLKKYKIKPLTAAKKLIEKADAIILVDASDTFGIDETIKPSKVVQIIDHRAHNDIESFKKAIVEIETIGATSTLIAEKFIETNTELPTESAILLYGGIISNTINFKNKLTSNRDKRTATWLTTKFNVPADFTDKMFKAKSTFKDKTIYQIVDEQLAVFKFHRARIAIAQIEIIEAEKFVTKNLDDILKAMRRLGSKYEVHHIFIKVIDVMQGRNIFIAEELETQKLLVKNFQLEFEANIAHTHHVLVRKEIVPVLKSYFEGSEFDIAAIRPKDFNHFVRHHDDEEEEFTEPAMI
jgi:inorganic pyrophosphatase/exopolyphosphatase